MIGQCSLEKTYVSFTMFPIPEMRWGISPNLKRFNQTVQGIVRFRPDNADMRLTKKGYQHGAVSENRYNHFLKILYAYNETQDLLKSLRYPMNFWKKIIPRLENARSTKG